MIVYFLKTLPSLNKHSALVLAFNKINIDAALLHLTQSSAKYSFTVILYDSSRVKAQDGDSCQSYFWFPLNRGTLILFNVISLILKITLFTPHIQNGTLIRSLASKSAKIFLIDDGLDSYRLKPRNGQDLLAPKVRTYICIRQENLDFSPWCHKFNIKNYSLPLQNLTNKEVAISFDLHVYDHLVIESPGIKKSTLNKISGNACVFVHPNINKQSDSWNDFDSFSFPPDVSIERVLSNLPPSKLHIGFTYTLVRLLTTNLAFRNPNEKINIYLNHEANNITSSLLLLINQHNVIFLNS